MSIETTRQDIGSIQMLRGMAALMVVFVHLDVGLGRLGYGALGTGWMSFGVDIFFVISGFIMWVSVERRPDITARQFMWNRIVRIVPLYWLLTSALLTVALVRPDVLHTTVLNVNHVVASFLFVPVRHPSVEAFWPLLIPGWSLNYEMYFYVLFAVAIRGSLGSARRRFAIIAGALVATTMLANLLSSRVDVANFYASPMLIEFLAGILIGVAFCRVSIEPRWVWLCLVLAGFTLRQSGLDLATPGTVNCAAAALIVTGAVFAPNADLLGLKELGDASYSLYLTHVLTLGVVEAAWAAWAFDGASAVAFGALAIAMCLLIAFLTHYLVEKPMTREFRNIGRFPKVLRRSEV